MPSVFLGHDIQLQATLNFLHWRCILERSDQTTRCFFVSLYYQFILCFMWFVFVPLSPESPANHEQKLINVVCFHWFSSVKLSSCSLRPGTSMALPVSSRPSPSISPSSWRFFCISFHCCLDSTAFVRRISGMAPERFKSPRPKHSYPMLSHAIPCYLQSWFCFGAFWLNNVVLLVSLTVVSSNLSKLIISASAPLISVTSDVLLSAWAFKHLNISIEGHDASTRNWDANKPLTCLLIIACVVGDLFAKKTLHQSESNIHHRNEVVVEKTYERRTTVTKLRKQILIFQSWHAKLSQCQNWGVFFAEWTQRTSKNHDILVCFFPSQPGVTTTCTANFGSTSYATP